MSHVWPVAPMWDLRPSQQDIPADSVGAMVPSDCDTLKMPTHTSRQASPAPLKQVTEVPCFALGPGFGHASLPGTSSKLHPCTPTFLSGGCGDHQKLNSLKQPMESSYSLGGQRSKMG